MKIIITEPELTQIVRNHVLSTVSMQDGRDIQIDFSATRGADGVTATIDIPYTGVAALDLSTQQQVAQDTVIAPPVVKAEKVVKPKAIAAAAAPVGIFAEAKAEADAAVADSPVAEETTASDTAAAVEGSAQEDAAPAPSAAAGVSLFP